MLEGLILAGGRGERFWPVSRRRRPKQLLALIGGTGRLEIAANLESAAALLGSPAADAEVTVSKRTKKN